jgi:hypothetical protein
MIIQSLFVTLSVPKQLLYDMTLTERKRELELLDPNIKLTQGQLW